MRTKTPAAGLTGCGCSALHGLYLFDIVLIACDKKGVETAAIWALLAIFYSRVSLLTVLTEGDGGERFDFQLRFLEKLRLFSGIQPEIREIAWDYSADLADLKRYRADCGQLVLGGDLFNGVYHIYYGA